MTAGKIRAVGAAKRFPRLRHGSRASPASARLTGGGVHPEWAAFSRIELRPGEAHAVGCREDAHARARIGDRDQDGDGDPAAGGDRASGAARAGKVDIYALVGARVVPVSGPVIENGTVILRDGVIEAVGSKLTIPPDARVIDGKGLTVTPGLIDAFGGLGLPAPRPPTPPAGGGDAPAAAPAVPATPPVSPLQPQALALDRLRPAEALRARDQGITNALVISREGVLPGRSVLLSLNGNRPRADGPAPAGRHAPAHGHQRARLPGVADGHHGPRPAAVAGRAPLPRGVDPV
jgi:hypothetical protein